MPRPPARPAADPCETCASPVVEISLAPVAGAAPVILRSCSRCDTRYWLCEDGALPLADVLTLVAPSR